MRLADQLNSCLITGNVPEWMATGRTVLIVKDPEKGAAVGNHRSITCLPIMWKTLTGIFSDDLYTFLDEEGTTRRTKRVQGGLSRENDQLFINKMTLKESKTRKKNLAMGWIDYKKAYDMIPHSWIAECLGMFGVTENVKYDHY